LSKISESITYLVKWEAELYRYANRSAAQLKGRVGLIETLLLKFGIFFNTMEKIRLKIPYRYRENRRKTENISLTYDINDHAYYSKSNSV